MSHKFAGALLLILFALLQTLAPAAAQEGAWLDALEPITAANAARIEQVAQIKCACRYPGAIEWSPDGSLLAVASAGNVWLYFALEPARPPIFLRGTTDSVSDLKFSPDGKLLAVGNSTIQRQLENQVTIWELEKYIRWRVFPLSRQSVQALAFRNDHTLLTADYATLQHWDIETSSLIRQFPLEGMSSIPVGAVFSPDNTRLLIGIGGINKTVRVWDVKTGRHITDWYPYPFDLTYSHDGSRLVASNFGISAMWNPNTLAHKEITIARVYSLIDLAFSPDDRLLAAVAKVQPKHINITLYPVDSCRQAQSYSEYLRGCPIVTSFAETTFDPHSYYIQIAFNPAGTLLASVSPDGIIRLWGIRQQEDSP